MTPAILLAVFLGAGLIALLLFVLGKATGLIKHRPMPGGGIWTEGGNEHLRGQD